MSITLTLSGSSERWPNRDPVESQTLEDGRIRHKMEDGRVLTIPPEPTYILHYQSRMIDAEPGDYFEASVAIAGWCPYAEGFVECWNYDRNQHRSYAINKILRLVSIPDGKEVATEKLRETLDALK